MRVSQLFPKEVTSRLRHQDEMKLEQSPLHKSQILRGRKAKGIKAQRMLHGQHRVAVRKCIMSRSIRAGFPESEFELLSRKQGITEDLSQERDPTGSAPREC